MDPQQCGSSLDESRGNVTDLTSIFCGPKCLHEHCPTVTGGSWAPSSRPCLRPDCLPATSDLLGDLDAVQVVPKFAMEWRDAVQDLVTHDIQQPYCSPSPCDSSSLSLVSYDAYDDPACLCINMELETPDSRDHENLHGNDLGGSPKASSATSRTTSLLQRQQRSRVRARFTPDEDQLIVRLRNNGKTWKAIAEQIPGRSPGALQVRYSTKLKISATGLEKGLVCRWRQRVMEKLIS